MSTVLLIVFLLLGGALLTHLMEWRRMRGQWELATLLVAVVSIIWLWARNGLPMELTLSDWSLASQNYQWRLFVDESAWQLTFYLFVSVLAVVSIGTLNSRSASPEQRSPLRRRSPMYALWLSLAAALALWADSVAGLVTGWMLFDLAWLAHLWGVRTGEGQARPNLIQFGWLMASTLALWMAAVAGPGEFFSPAESGAPAGLPLGLVILAALWRMGAFPLHWWRPWNGDFRPEAMFLIHVLPVILGASLLRVIVPEGGLSGSLLLLFTTMGLLGLLAGTTWAWARIGEPTLIPVAIVLGQASMLVLVASWVGSDALLAESRVLILAPAVLILGNSGLKNRSPWLTAAAVIAAGALAGLPFTAGFDGRVALLTLWQNDGQLVLALVATLLYFALIAAAILMVRTVHGEGPRWKRPSLEQAIVALAMMLPAIGLVRPGEQSLGDVQPLTLGLLLLTAGGAFALSLRVGPVRQAGKSVRDALQAGFSWYRLKEVSSLTVAAALNAVKEGAAIMEGEGGMLWLLLLVVVLWLARGG